MADSTQREIALIREYRTRLIADVVTGKLDVHEAAAALPEEVEDEQAPTEDEASLDDNAFDEAESGAGAEEDSA